MIVYPVSLWMWNQYGLRFCFVCIWLYNCFKTILSPPNCFCTSLKINWVHICESISKLYSAPLIYMSIPVVFNRMISFPSPIPRDIWQYLETILIVTTVVLLVSSGQRLGILLNILQYMGQLLTKIYIYMVQNVSNPKI